VRTSILIVLAAVATAACSASAGTPSPSPATMASSHAPAALPRLVFFMNPNGTPCQLQDRVLRELAPQLSGRAVLVYYRTTEPADLAQFGRYGIRSIPMLLVTDGDGRELRRATPGIHTADEIRALLAP
jgi:thioredoxin 1